MTLEPHISLSFDGHCEAALRFYAQHLNGTITYMLRYGGSPMAEYAPPDWGQKVAHATLKIGDTVITGADLPPGRYESPRGFEIVLPMSDPALAERLFQALSENGVILMPLQETFWALRFGVLTDQFGIRWSINCEAPQST